MNKPTVFVVDDEAQICALLTRILAREGYSVRAFPGGREALDALPSAQPDLLVTDLMMPGMSGLELARKARAARPSMGTILITGYASVDNVVEALRSGVDDFVTKPFSVAEIRAVVDRVLEARGLRGRAPAPAPAGAARAAAPVSAAHLGGDVAADVAAANVALARRFHDMSVIESIHGVLAEELSSADLVPRCDSTLASALASRRAVLLAPGSQGGTFRVRSATLRDAPWTTKLDLELGVVSLVVASGAGGPVDREPLGTVAALLDEGPVAAAPLSPGDPQGEDSGVLLVSRAPGSARFDGEDLHLLGVAAAAMGDVFRVLRTAERAEDAYAESLARVVAATESRSPWFARHSERVHELSLRLGRRAGLGASDLDTLDMASRLLDLGRVELPDEVLGKTGSPTAEEWRALRNHVVVADDVIRPLGRLRNVKPVVRHHHENWDGSGYPDGLRGDHIPPLAALVRITDAFAALTEARSWRPALESGAAVRQIVDLSGTHFHPQLVASFAEMLFCAGTDAPAAERAP